MDENALAQLFELEPAEDFCDHGSPALPEGWQDSVPLLISDFLLSGEQ